MVRILMLLAGLGLAGCTYIEVTESFKIGRHLGGQGYGFRVCRPMIGQLKKAVIKACGSVIKTMKWQRDGECLVYPNYLVEGPPYLSLCFGPMQGLTKIYALRKQPPLEQSMQPPTPYAPCGPGDSCGPDMDCAGQEVGLKFCTPKCRSDAGCSPGVCQLNLSQSGNPDHCVLTCKKNQIDRYGCMADGVCASIGEDADVGFCVHPDAVQP